MIKTITNLVAIIVFVCLSVQPCYAEKFGKIYDIQGTVFITHADKEPIKLSLEEHVLYPINVGDIIETKQDSLVLIVATKGGKGYEIQQNSQAVIKADKPEIEGKAKERQGLTISIPDSIDDSIGGMVLRSRRSISIINPQNTAILELTPDLLWSANSTPGTKFKIDIFSDENAVFSAESSDFTIKVPEGILRYGTTYRWIVDGGLSLGISGGVFLVPEEEQVNTLQKEIKKMKLEIKDLPDRLSFIFYLIEKNLLYLAKDELKSLSEKYPHNTYIKDLI